MPYEQRLYETEIRERVEKTIAILWPVTLHPLNPPTDARMWRVIYSQMIAIRCMFAFMPFADITDDLSLLAEIALARSFRE